MTQSLNSKDHWDSIYQSKSDGDLSWTQPEPLVSLKLIGEACASGRVIDIGGGTSVLAERLLERGYTVAVLDISDAALERGRKRLGARASQIQWIVADVTAGPSLEPFDVWHDRAVFHFLTDPVDRAAYISLLAQTVPVGGHAVIGTFALDGPQKCSGLEVRRYNGYGLAFEIGPHFNLLKSEAEVHVTPQGNEQSFQLSLFRRV
jgi:SAM-dependent methyltransferase